MKYSIVFSNSTENAAHPNRPDFEALKRSVNGGIQGGTAIFLSILMSFIGSALIPVVTFLFIYHQWRDLQ